MLFSAQQASQLEGRGGGEGGEGIAVCGVCVGGERKDSMHRKRCGRSTAKD